jgi:hypothetical protein
MNMLLCYILFLIKSLMVWHIHLSSLLLYFLFSVPPVISWWLNLKSCVQNSTCPALHPPRPTCPSLPRHRWPVAGVCDSAILRKVLPHEEVLLHSSMKCKGTPALSKFKLEHWITKHLLLNFQIFNVQWRKAEVGFSEYINPPSTNGTFSSPKNIQFSNIFKV